MTNFIFATCQVGAERAVKSEIARRWPAFRFAYSQPGFLTFKTSPDVPLQADFRLDAVFARAYGLSLGKVVGASPKELAAAAWKLCSQYQIQRVHIWHRDCAPVGEHGYQPSITDRDVEYHRLLLETCPRTSGLARDATDLNQPARIGELILDCIVLAPNMWWVGFHQAVSVESRYPGGMMPLRMPPDAVSRAWLKMEEALRWSQLPIPRGARFAELGSAPGGAAQALLARGLVVFGIDPAEMHPTVLQNPRFFHIRRRSAGVRRREFRKVRWLSADMNVAPRCTLDAVESIVTHPEVNIRGLLLTLKLPDWHLADELPDQIERIRGWGYNIIRARQLQHNRSEVCIAALQKPFRRKPHNR